jgi:hypothetical protein
MGRRSSGYPYWVFPTKRLFQRKKRADLKRLLAALNEARNGIAFVPGYREHWDKLQKHAEALIEGARPGNWR